MEPCPPSVGYGNDKGKNFSRISAFPAPNLHTLLSRSRIDTCEYCDSASRAVRRRQSECVLLFGQQPAEGADERKVSCGPPRAEAAAHTVLRTVIFTRGSPIPRQKRFRAEGGRGDGALRIENLLIASKVPKASDSAQAQGRPRNRFTAAVFRLPFVRTKGNV